MRSPSLDAHPRVGDWIRLDEPGIVTVRSGKVEIGQRISTALLATAAGELSVSPGRLRLAAVVTDDAPDEGMTSGSNSIEHSAEAVRLAAATARRHLLERAAAALARAPESLELADGLVRDPHSNRSISYWELVPGGIIDVPVEDAGTARAPDEAVLDQLREARATALATGAERFVHDLRMEGMLHARVVRPPHDHATLESLELPSPGDPVELVREGSFVALAGPSEYEVVRAAERVARVARWDPGAGLDGGDVFDRLTANARVSLPVVAGTPAEAPVPAADEAPEDAVARHAARYERPYQMHGAIGPSAAMALLRDGVLWVWTHSQGVYPLRDSLAAALGMAPERVRLEHVPGAGCYGHNGADDAALDAALVARALPGRPVLLKWSRQDEHAFEPYAPAMVIEMAGSLDAQGRVATWSHEAYSDTHLRRPRPGPGDAGPARLLATRWLPEPPQPFVAQPAMGTHTGIHRNAEPYYRFERPRVVKHLVRDLPLRTSAMRTLGGFMNVFAIECFLDELAHAAELDPLVLRYAHLADPRARELLERVADGIGWTERPRPAANGHGVGLAFGRYKNRQAYAAVAVAVSAGDSAEVRLEHAVIAADAGRVVDHDGLVAQLEGGLLQAASWTRHEAVGFDEGGVTTRDWDSYPILRFDEVPVIDVAIVDRPEQPPLGAGEAVCGPAGAAIANAVFDATGLRVRRLPLTPDALRRAAMA